MFRQSIDADEIDQVTLARRSTERLKMAAERALCTNADCHHDLSACSQPPSFCPACSAPVITVCPTCKKALAETKDPWAKLCESCGEQLRFHTNQTYYGVM